MKTKYRLKITSFIYPTTDIISSLHSTERYPGLCIEAAATTNGWDEHQKATELVLALRAKALQILQNIPEEKQNDYSTVVGALELRFGSKYLSQVYQNQLKSRSQGPTETLQEFSTDFKRMVRLAYPEAPEEFIKQLNVQSFIDGVKDPELQQALRLGRFKSLSEAVIYGLEFEAAKNVSRQNKVREVKVIEPVNSDEDKGSSQRILEEILALRKKSTGGDQNQAFRNSASAAGKLNTYRGIVAVARTLRNDARRQREAPPRMRIPVQETPRCQFDEFILGLDIMKQFNFISVDFEKRLFEVGNKEIFYSTPTEKNNRIRLIMDEDVRILGNTEAIVTAHLEGKPDGVDIVLVELDASRHEDALVAKCLMDGRWTVPVRVANLNVNRVTLKKGEAMHRDM
ncbi:hypothetical protein NQ315_013667 [Exocentrus adspersus]|uniref:Retrotransposon gag domain-containing protein n=1 Tax=Exocentrus adspersus TaxID=1586481 RepID=A0AAV8W4F7_9CUCU|nr:hypothetical protein NQ315_013667 [Exocentrus adspersus]